ncbi:MAG: phospholipase D family protein [Desulfobulbaceae bacterium]|nr:MAG: phospholipase D family protein [Desulfobulbaceae bacterium]
MIVARLPIIIFLTALLLFSSDHTASGTTADGSSEPLHLRVHRLLQSHPGESGAFVLEKGEESLLARAWLTDRAQQRIDVQYFIWSTDNIGILAAEALLRAAKRGVKIRVIVDDLLIDAPDRVMVALDAHPNVQVRIYNPKHSVGTSFIKRLVNIAFQFRSVNQRMHDKTFTVDGLVSITGGRNMADEYFDYNRQYNFRDRDILLIGPVVKKVGYNFESFWSSELVVPVKNLLNDIQRATPADEFELIYQELHDYAKDPVNFEPEVREALAALPGKFQDLENALSWGPITFTHDKPGKNTSGTLSGGGDSTTALIDALAEAKQSVLIQSPYLVMPKGGIEFFNKLVQRGVEVKISTNSLASTDNLQAFSGFSKQRKKILQAGVQVYEYKPKPLIQKQLIDRYEAIEKQIPTFAIHAKTMVIDHETVFVGTFNLDPRSANLNTEVGVILKDKKIASRVENAIMQDILPENSWDSSKDSPDQYAPLVKRVKVFFWKLLPLTPLL